MSYRCIDTLLLRTYLSYFKKKMNLLTIEKVKEFQSKNKEKENSKEECIIVPKEEYIIVPKEEYIIVPKGKNNCFLPPIKNTFRYISFKMKCTQCSFVAEEAGNSEANAKYHTELTMANHRAKCHENDKNGF